MLVFTEDATRASATVHRIATFALHDDEWHLRADVHPPLPELTLARLNTETWPELHDLWGWARKMLGELNAAPRGVPHPYLVVMHSAAWLQRDGRGREPLCECKADLDAVPRASASEGIDHDT